MVERDISEKIILVGLGPGSSKYLTREAWDVLSRSAIVYVRTLQHPAISELPDAVKINSFDDLYESLASFEQVYDKITEEIISLSEISPPVIYAVPGHPFVAEATCTQIMEIAGSRNIPVRVVDGLSFVEPTFSALGIDPLPQTAFVDALTLVDSHFPPFPPSHPALIAQIYSQFVASNVKLTLMELYPDEHPVSLVHNAGTSELKIENLPLYEIDRSPHMGSMTSLYLPALGPATSLEEFQEVIAHLRAPDGCPWDREQDHQTLRPNLLEEAYEVLEAIDADDPEAMMEELGDLLLQIVLHAQIGAEYGEFTMSDIIHGIQEKIVRRHPHVFGELDLDDAEGVIVNWEKLKTAERQMNGQEEKGLLDGVANALPALEQSQTIQRRVARVGFDWPEIDGVLAKIQEEIGEVNSARDDEERSDEIGDLLFAMVNLARWYKIDAESALRTANARFRKRFRSLERNVKQQGKDLSEMNLVQLDELWEVAKRENKNTGPSS